MASFIQQKRDMGYKSTAAVQTVDQVKDHLGAGKHFWAVLRGDKECQGKLLRTKDGKPDVVFIFVCFCVA